MSAVEVRLRRPSSDTAWGFRLQGGQDVNAPLTVQRVFNGSPADGNLQRGDVLLSINGTDVSSVYLKKAEELVKASSNSLSIAVRRAGQPVNSSQPHIDLPTQQTVVRKVDSSPSQPQQPQHQVPLSVGSSPAHQPHQQSGRPLTQSNVWRPPTQSSVSYNDHLQTTAGEVYHPVKNQWSTSSPSHLAGESAGGYGHRQWSDATASAGTRSGFGGHPQTGNERATSVHDDHLFPPFSGSSNATPAQHGLGTAQSYAKQQQMSPQSTSHGSHSSVEPHHQQQQQQPPTVDDDDDAYEVKSVRDIKQMFNQMAKPSSLGPKKASPKPHVWQKTSPQEQVSFSTNNSTNWNAAPSVLSPSTKPVSHSTPAAARSFASPPKASPSSSYYDDLYGSYPPPRQDSAAISQPTRPILAKAITPQPKPGAGYSYQGIVTVTPAKTVHGKGKTSGGGSGQANKKKEFDPSQSLVFQALQEENERAKRGEVASPEEEPPRARGQTTGAYGGQRNAGTAAAQQNQQQRSARLQELLERDQAQAQQQDDQKYGVSPSASSPHMTAQARREMSPSYPRHQQHQEQRQQHQYQQNQHQYKPGPSAQHEHHQQHQSSVASRQQSYQQPQTSQLIYQQSSAPVHGYHNQQQQYGNSYNGGYSQYGDTNNRDIPISDF